MTRKFPIGIQSLEIIHKENYLYVDKTDIVYHLVNNTRYGFFSRPREVDSSISRIKEALRHTDAAGVMRHLQQLVAETPYTLMNTTVLLRHHCHHTNNL